MGIINCLASGLQVMVARWALEPWRGAEEFFLNIGATPWWDGLEDDTTTEVAANDRTHPPSP